MISLRLVFMLLLAHSFLNAGKIAILGSGYVGLTMAAFIADTDDLEIVCFDIDQARIAMLNKREVQQFPIYEPGVPEKLSESRNITFSHNLDDVKESDIYFICVPTPSDGQGKCDLTYVFAAIDSILKLENNKMPVICIKSTIAPGSMAKIHAYLEEKNAKTELVFNPEFLREGSALKDIEENPIVLGSHSKEDSKVLKDFYKKVIGKNAVIERTNYATAEMYKYAWNSFRAIKIAFANELADTCNLTGADINTIIAGMARSEEHLPTHKLRPGPGYGGSCFPKDTSGFHQFLLAHGFKSSIVGQAIESNNLHKQRLIQQILDLLPQEGPKAVAILGLAFKANTNDIRETPAIDVIKELLARQVEVHAYDPQANENMKQLFPTVSYHNCPYQAVQNTDCVVALTEWDQIKNIDLSRVAALCKTKKAVDARNLYFPEELKKHGFEYRNMGAL